MKWLSGIVDAEIRRPVQPEVAAVAAQLATRHGGAAVLFYGSILRTGDLSGVLDFYVLQAPGTPGGAWGRLIWPAVSYHELRVGTRVLRAKVATMPLDIFERAAAGLTLDTTIWARFAQPSALVWVKGTAARVRVGRAIEAAIVTAARFAVLHHTGSGRAAEFWQALFRATYAIELRIEPPGRERQLVVDDVRRFDLLLPLAWTRAGIDYRREGDTLTARPREGQLRDIGAAWMAAAAAGRWLNAARLFKAASTFEGAARYALWKIERHTGVCIPLTSFRERHPVLAAPGVFWTLWRRAT